MKKKKVQNQLQNSSRSLMVVGTTILFVLGFGAAGLLRSYGHYIHAQSTSCPIVSPYPASICVQVTPGGLSANATTAYHTMGTCNPSSAVGTGTSLRSTFTIPANCNGNSFGNGSSYPSDMWVTSDQNVGYNGATYTLGNWTGPQAGNTNNGTISCSASAAAGPFAGHPACDLAGMTSGAAVLVANYNCASNCAPSAPGLSVAGSSQSSITVNWSAAQAHGVASMSSYTVYMDNAAVASVGAGTLSYARSGLACSQNHSFTIVANDTLGQTSTSNTVTASTNTCPVPAPKPTSGGSTSTPTSSTSGGGNLSLQNVSVSPTPAAPGAATSTTPSDNGVQGSGDTGNNATVVPPATGTSASTLPATAPKKHNVWMTVAVIILIIILLPALGLGGYLLYKLYQRRHAAVNKYESYVQQERGY